MLNDQLFFLIHNLSSKSLILDSVMIFCAEYLIYFLMFIAPLSIILINRPTKKGLSLLALGGGISFLFVYLIRIFYLEDRPFITFPLTTLITNPTDPSFPSIHTLSAAIIAFVFYFLKSKLFILFLVATLLTGFSRIYVGVHFPGDILGSILIAVLGVFLGDLIYQKILKKNILLL